MLCRYSPGQVSLGDCGWYNGAENSSFEIVPADMQVSVAWGNSDYPGSCGRYQCLLEAETMLYRISIVTGDNMVSASGAHLDICSNKYAMSTDVYPQQPCNESHTGWLLLKYLHGRT